VKERWETNIERVACPNYLSKIETVAAGTHAGTLMRNKVIVTVQWDAWSAGRAQFHLKVADEDYHHVGGGNSYLRRKSTKKEKEKKLE